MPPSPAKPARPPGDAVPDEHVPLRRLGGLIDHVDLASCLRRRGAGDLSAASDAALVLHDGGPVLCIISVA